MRLIAQEALTIAVDYQEKLIPAMHDKDELIRSSAVLLEGLALLQVPVIVSRQYPEGLGDTIAPLRAVTKEAKVYDKTTFSCYHNAEIRKAIEDSKRKKIIICGTEAHVCVLQTTIDLLADGYEVYYVTDCVGSRRAFDKKMGIKRVLKEGAMPTTYEALLFELQANATSPTFRSISKLVK